MRCPLRRLSILLLLFYITMFLIVGCSGETESLDVEQDESTLATPLPTNFASPAGSDSVSVVPTPMADAATIYGQLMLLDPTVIAPQEDGLYLVPVDADSDQMMVVPMVVEGEALQAQVDETTGNFVFTNVDVGHYILVAIIETGQERTVHRLGTNEAILPVVDEEDLGKAIDLGICSLP